MTDPSPPTSKLRFRFPRWPFPQRQTPPRPRRRHPFGDTEVRAKAQQVYEQRRERGIEGTPEGDWQQAIRELRWERSLLGGTQNLFRLAWRADTPKDAIEVLKMGISALGLIATVAAVVGLVINYQQGQERLITDRFAKAVEQLGNASPNVQIGGVYSLERIAKDSPKDHWTVMEVLTAYVRDKSPMPKGWISTPPGKRKPLSNVSNEVQSVLTVIGRRDAGRDPEVGYLNLTRANLQGANLYQANLQGARLVEANLQGSNLSGAKLQKALLWKANLQGAYLRGANLQGADLVEANLQGAYLRGANLQGAYLYRADLSTAEGLTDDQLNQAYLCQTKLTKGSKLNPNRDCPK